MVVFKYRDLLVGLLLQLNKKTKMIQETKTTDLYCQQNNNIILKQE